MEDFDNDSSANSESVTKDKTNIKANLSEETETDDEKSSDGNDGMEVEDGEDIGYIEAQMTPEVDDVVGSKTKSDEVVGADRTDENEENPKRKSKRTSLKRFSTKSWEKQSQPATNAKLQVS